MEACGPRSLRIREAWIEGSFNECRPDWGVELLEKFWLNQSQETGISLFMKKLMLSVITLAFAVAVQAGDSKKASDKDQPACCSKKVSAQAAGATCTMAGKGKTACAAGACEKAPVKQALLSPKGAEQASLR